MSCFVLFLPNQTSQTKTFFQPLSLTSPDKPVKNCCKTRKKKIFNFNHSFIYKPQRFQIVEFAPKPQSFTHTEPQLTSGQRGLRCLSPSSSRSICKEPRRLRQRHACRTAADQLQLLQLHARVRPQVLQAFKDDSRFSLSLSLSLSLFSLSALALLSLFLQPSLSLSALPLPLHSDSPSH